MKERPILMSGPMVRATLDDQKTNTRRVIRPQFTRLWGQGIRHGEDTYSAHVDIPAPDGWKWLRCPYGQPGDRLWVRETWNCIDTGRRTQRQDWVRYRATDGEEMHWRPSIFMPRWASRITLDITGVRVERVQDISEADAIAEGVTASQAGDGYPFAMSARMNFVDLWDGINAKRGYGWADNPWVWAITFERAA